MVPFCQLFRFAEGRDYIYLIVGIIFAMAAGCSFPFFAYIWGKAHDIYLTLDPQSRVDQSVHYRNILFFMGIGTLAASWTSFACWLIMSERMSVACRKAYLRSMFRHDVGWFDSQNQFELSQKFNTDSRAYQRAIG